ncbi:diguanylate cyclase [Pseudomonas sp. LS1212]|uniref:diguanylate cyclase n=1 Tax=Pseudomonas sp. LS1212 TaxID=2972478 RepID=UPI00215B9DA7|nr:diguanylate cyclase [Pseudomonas sp. LS1212]UVJ44119.1 diguanylate cyclase [Pseudomonas sp. LS1212]
MTEEAQRWKEKYLKSIEQQEKLERRWEARLDLLRQGLVRSTLAAEGSDRAVDQCMKEVREVIRTDNMDAALSALIPRLEKAVLDSEQRREIRIGQISTALTSLVTQLQALPLPGDVSKPLKKFAKQLDSRASQPREVPLLLGELSGLQGRALAYLEEPEEPARPGLFQRLFGAREAEVAVLEAVASPVPVPVPVAVPVVVAASLPVMPSAAVAVAVAVDVDELVPQPESATEPSIQPNQPAEAAPAIVEASVANESASTPIDSVDSVDAAETAKVSTPPPLPAVIDETNTPEPQPSAEHAQYALPDGIEPSYSSVAEHIEETLLGLLNDLTLPERHQEQAQSMRERLEHGLNWYELLPILDDLAVLMLAINDSGQHEFEVYLKQLNERLESFQSHLQDASEGHAGNSSAARDMDNQLREQVDGLQSSVQDAADLDSLKHILESRLEGLLGTMDQHQQQRDQREHEVAARLQSLAERVASMEQEALGYREHLEEQRQKALIDPLTGLPNRAAWSERLDQELQGWQQSGGDLLLAVLDLDHFKRINDNYGHLAGDKVLKIIANELRKRLRPTDFIARIGGEEFVLLAPATPLGTGVKLAETLRAAIEACPFHFKSEPVTITVSIGITAFKAGERSELVFKRADQALYRAKNAGRNRIEAA